MAIFLTTRFYHHFHTRLFGLLYPFCLKVMFAEFTSFDFAFDPAEPNVLRVN